MLRRSPVLVLLLVAIATLVVLLIRDLDIGHLQTDVIIMRSWFDEVGAAGFTERYFHVNQRHLLVGPINTLAMTAFGDHNLPYNLIFQAGRLLSGVFLGGIAYQLSRRYALALCVGLAMMFTPIRLAELYQGINWYIEPTLTLLLAAIYCYTLNRTTGWWGYYALSVSLYLLSILIYESGLPWIAVYFFLGWITRLDQPVLLRTWRALRDSLLLLLFGLILAWMLLFVFEPWDTLKPSEGGLFARLLNSASTLLTFPLVWARMLLITLRDGYTLLIAVCALAATLILALFPRSLDTPLRIPTSVRTRNGASISTHNPSSVGTRFIASTTFPQFYLSLLGLSLVMFALSILVGASSGGISPAYLDRINFGRAAGITLFYVTAMFALFDLLPFRRLLAPALAGLLLIGPGFAWLLIYQNYAHTAFAEIDRINNGLMQLRPMIAGHAHFIILTDPDWVAARFNDASDVIVHEVQQQLWAQNADATLDILHTAAHPEEYATHPGTCDTLSGEYSAGMCISRETIYSSRWAAGTTHEPEWVVLVHYESESGTMSVIDSLALNDLQGYNIATADVDRLATDPARLAIPLPVEIRIVQR